MMQVTRNGAVFKIKDRWAMFRQMYALEKAKDFAALKKKKHEKGTKRLKNIGKCKFRQKQTHTNK